jgi:hypothetical protein
VGNAIRIQGLTKYHGRNRGIAALDLAVGPGQVFGFLGGTALRACSDSSTARGSSSIGHRRPRQISQGSYA